MALITYDVSGKQIEVKKMMEAKEYIDHWFASNVKYYLPNTTLWKDRADVSTAINDLKNVAAYLGVRLIRAVAVPHSPFSGITGDPHS